nr:hypothetical protein [Tanacetum cinerariifolium]
MSLGESDDLVLLDAEPAGPVFEAGSLPKFDMHIQRSSLTETQVEWLVKCYGIPADLHSLVVPEGMTMNALPNDALGLYAHRFQQGGLRVVISLRKPPPSILYVAGLLNVWKHAGHAFFLKDSKGKVLSMAEFLRLPNFKGCKITVGALLPAGVARVTHLANPAATIEDIPPKTVDMTMAEIPCQMVKVGIDKGAGKDGPRKRRKIRARPQVQPVSEHVSYPTPLNHAEPLDTLANEGRVSPPISAKRMGVLRAQTDEHVTPRANVDETATEEEAHANLVIEGHGDNEEGLSGLKTQPNPIRRPCISCLLLRRSWKMLCQSAQQQANTLLRFEALKEEYANLVYAHESCKDVKNYEGALVREKSTQDRLEELEEEKRESDNQLRREKEHYDVEAGRGEMVRQRIINQYLPTFVRGLNQSAEYKRLLGRAFSLVIGKGFIDGISIGRTDANIQAILKATPEVDPASSDVFISGYEKIFDQRYSYVDKVARMYLLDPSGLQNIMPDETGPTPGGGPRDTPTASYA